MECALEKRRLGGRYLHHRVQMGIYNMIFGIYILFSLAEQHKLIFLAHILEAFLQ
jgi:hypothetical protein